MGGYVRLNGVANTSPKDHVGRRAQSLRMLSM
jgi:hypothetical protein